MIPTHQTIQHDPANGKHGNCLSAVLASLLHLDINQVPVFVNPVTWRRELNAWLRPMGLAYLSIRDWPAWCEETGIAGSFHEIAGPSPRHPEVLHACVGKDGQMVFDPHPGEERCPSYEEHGLFVALEPWRHAAAVQAAPADLDPNLTLNGRFASQRVRLVFGQWEYRLQMEVEVRGNITGLDVIQSACERAYDQLVARPEGATLVLKHGEDTLVCSDDDSLEEVWLQRMLLSATVFSVTPIPDHVAL